MSEQEYIALKDGTKIPADDFWFYAPFWLVEKYAEPYLSPVTRPDSLATDDKGADQ